MDDLDSYVWRFCGSFEVRVCGIVCFLVLLWELWGEWWFVWGWSRMDWKIMLGEDFWSYCKIKELFNDFWGSEG